jgi:hypothetical protein
MPLPPATVAKLQALAALVIEKYGTELALIVNGPAQAPKPIVKPVPPPGPPPIPVPRPEPRPTDFDELFYLASWPDIAKAVRAGEYPTGGAHYLEWGRKEGRQYRRNGPGTPGPNAPVAPTPDAWMPSAAYPNGARLLMDLLDHKFTNAVTVDGVRVYDGFGPALKYYKWPDETIRNTSSGQIPLPLEPGDGEIVDLT